MYPTPERPTNGIFVEQQIRGLRAKGVEIEIFFVDRLSQGMSCYYRMRRALAAAVERFQPDLLHVMYGGVMADQVTRQFPERPLVVTFHGSDLFGENHSGWVRKWISHYGVRCSWRAAQRAREVVVVSRFLEALLPSGVDRSKVRINPCGVDLERFEPLDREECRRRLGWAEDGFQVLFSSNAGDPVKRPALAREAVALLRRSGIRAELHYLHDVPYADVPRWLNASDAVILPSFQEGASTIVKEALACKVPVVSVDVGDVAERIEGIAGCYLAEPNADDLAEKLGRVWGAKPANGAPDSEIALTPPLSRPTGEGDRMSGEGFLVTVHALPRRVNGRQKMQDFSIERIAARLRDFYEEVLGTTRASRVPVPDPSGPTEACSLATANWQLATES